MPRAFPTAHSSSLIRRRVSLPLPFSFPLLPLLALEMSRKEVVPSKTSSGSVLSLRLNSSCHPGSLSNSRTVASSSSDDRLGDGTSRESRVVLTKDERGREVGATSGEGFRSGGRGVGVEKVGGRRERRDGRRRIRRNHRRAPPLEGS